MRDARGGSVVGMIDPKHMQATIEDGRLVLRMDPMVIRSVSADASEEAPLRAVYHLELIDGTRLECNQATYEAALTAAFTCPRSKVKASRVDPT